MNKEYICKKEKLSDALNEIDNFETMMTEFKEKHGNHYKYSVGIKEIHEELNKWEIGLKINNNDN